MIRQKSRRKKTQDSGTRIKHKATETEKNKRTQISCYKLINKTKQEKKISWHSSTQEAAKKNKFCQKKNIHQILPIYRPKNFFQVPIILLAKENSFYYTHKN